jgi:hypothetical protein
MDEVGFYRRAEHPETQVTTRTAILNGPLGQDVMKQGAAARFHSG